MNEANLIEAIREANLNVYRASPARLREDVGSEAEIAHDYQGRLIFELLQNADDAMGGAALATDGIRFRLTDHELLVMNSGRALTEADVRGLTSTGASSKTGSSEGGQRASIGHKGMGFKSILEITERPEVYSSTYAFVLDAERAHPAVSRVLTDLGHAAPDRVPIMRFPWDIDAPTASWDKANAAGFNVLFRFPFKEGLDPDKIANLAQSLLTLPATTILFLKHLEVVEIEVDTRVRSERISWTVRRERSGTNRWERTGSLTVSGIYRVWIESGGTEDIWCFLLGHEADLEIGNHRGGLNDYAWAGVNLTEVTVAALLAGGNSDELPIEWRRFHVFLPTAEVCPYPLLINGAFATDLSRQEIRVTAEAEDYNRFLIEAAAAVLCNRLLPAVKSHDGGIEAALLLLARDVEQVAASTSSSPASQLHQAVIAALASAPLVPTGADTLAPVVDIAVPETFGHSSIGSEFRDLFPAKAEAAGRALPVPELCSAPFASILIDHGARALRPSETANLLSSASPDRTHLELHESGKLSVDPVLRILQAMWENADKPARDELEQAVRAAPLFPVSKDSDGTVERIAVGETETFFPPRAMQGSIPLQGLRFMLQDLCWGTLTPRERTDVLRSQMPAWIALFQIREFKFPDVMRVSVLPALALDADLAQRSTLANWETLTAVCQLAGATPSPVTPLPYGRLGSQRALFNLCRIPVPCTVNGEEQWAPAYRAYFGTEWIGEASIEPLIAEAKRFEPTFEDQIPVVIGPEQFITHLEQMRVLETAVGIEHESNDEQDDEVDVDEDDEQATELDATERWLAFLTWLGVNRVLRPVHFHDAEDRAKGWISTRGLERPSGWAFKTLGSLWAAYVEQLRSQVLSSDSAEHDLYFYRLHDLEHLGQLTDLAAADASCGVAGALFTHLSRNWRQLERFIEVELAVIEPGKEPSRRVDPPRAEAKELKRFGADLWLFRLRRASFCPTKHGPQQPELTWWRSSEVERRFNHHHSTADMFLPILADVASAAQSDARKFSQAVGVRAELTPAVFSLRDARAFVERIEALYSDRAELKPDVFRNQINPAYQNLFELLSGSTTGKTPPPGEARSLRQTRLLVHDGRGHHRFVAAEEVLYAPRSGLREIYGFEGEIWTFVLEGRPAVSAPLQRLFGARNLDEVLDWRPQPDECPLDLDDQARFREGLREIAPYLLARLRAERAEEVSAARDANRLRDFIERVEPVRFLSASCSLDGNELIRGGQRQAFVDRTGINLIAFVRWGENPWPPDPGEAEALATAITELLGVGYFEPLLALLTAEPAGRDRLLHLAGASGNLDAARDALRPSDATAAKPMDHETDLPAPTQGEVVDGGNSIIPPSPAPTPPQPTHTQLVNLHSLSFDGDPLTEAGQQSGSPDPLKQNEPAGRAGRSGQPSAYGGGTDLDRLNFIGMRIAEEFEQRRLTRRGIEATIFDPDQPRLSDAVFNVSTQAAIDASSEASPRFKDALESLRRLGVAADVPGFDILTLDSAEGDGLGRLIELKSSGVSARTQAMTWNEWKTAGNPNLRSRFFLYLVGNLRADIEAAPFVRAIRDPFGQLIATEHSDRSVKRSVQLDTLAFDQAEYQELIVQSGHAPSR